MSSCGLTHELAVWTDTQRPGAGATPLGRVMRSFTELRVPPLYPDRFLNLQPLLGLKGCRPYICIPQITKESQCDYCRWKANCLYRRSNRPASRKVRSGFSLAHWDSTMRFQNFSHSLAPFLLHPYHPQINGPAYPNSGN